MQANGRREKQATLHTAFQWQFASDGLRVVSRNVSGDGGGVEEWKNG